MKTMTWHDTNNGRTVPTQSGMYLVTVACTESDDEGYYETRKSTCAKFVKMKNGYHWIWDDANGTNELDNSCTYQWIYDETTYSESIVAWANMPIPYMTDWDTTLVTVKKENIDFKVAEDGTAVLSIGGRKND